MKNVIIKSIARITGDNVVSNNELITKYKDLYSLNENKVKNILENKLGRNQRHIAIEMDNTLLFGAKALDSLLNKTGIDPKEIDVLLFSSQFPEFTCPTQSVLLHNHAKLKEECFALDVNANCAAGLYGMNVARNLLVSDENDFKYAVVIASDLMTPMYQQGCLVTEGCFGDAGVAILLEMVNSDEFVGLSNAKYAVTCESINNVFYPECGHSNQHTNIGDSTKLSWINPTYEKAIKYMGDNLFILLDKYRINRKQLKWVCCSQFTKDTGISMATQCNFDKDKLLYTGNKYGYTGVSSPFMPFYDALADGLFNKDDIIGLTTIGLGGQSISMFYKQQ